MGKRIHLRPFTTEPPVGKPPIASGREGGCKSTHPTGLYLRYIVGMPDPEVLHTTPERHIRCNPTLAHYIVADDFEPVVVEGPFDKCTLDADYVRERESLLTRGWRRLSEASRGGMPIIEYPLPDVVEAIRRRGNP